MAICMYFTRWLIRITITFVSFCMICFLLVTLGLGVGFYDYHTFLYDSLCTNLYVTLKIRLNFIVGGATQAWHHSISNQASDTAWCKEIMKKPHEDNTNPLTMLAMRLQSWIKLCQNWKILSCYKHNEVGACTVMTQRLCSISFLHLEAFLLTVALFYNLPLEMK